MHRIRFPSRPGRAFSFGIRPLLGALLLLLAADAGAFARADTLRAAAPTRIQIGCCVNSSGLQNPKIAALVTKQFNCLTPEYELMPQFMVDQGWRFTFERGDQVIAFAATHHLPVYAHLLVWHFVTRDWLFADANGQPLSRTNALANLQHYINGVMRHYQGRVQAWNVVNEALSDQPGEFLRDTPAKRAIGEDYVEKAFEYARQTDPQAELYYNDYNIEQPAKLAKTLKLIHQLQAKGIRLDAVGVQGHWLLNWPPTRTIEQGIDALAATGVKVMITELDIDPLPRESSGADMTASETGPNPYPHGLPPAMQQKLAQRYGEVVAAILRHPSVVMINFWGTDDGHSWLNDFPVKNRVNHPLLFDRQLEPKPAHDAVIRALHAAK
jgi:endo-1,4-beta-xylanase